MLGAYAEHLRRLKEQYVAQETKAATTSSLQSYNQNQHQATDYGEQRGSGISSNRFGRSSPSPPRFSVPSGGESGSPTVVRQLPLRSFEEEKSELLQLLANNNGSDNTTRSGTGSGVAPAEKFQPQPAAANREPQAMDISTPVQPPLRGASNNNNASSIGTLLPLSSQNQARYREILNEVEQLSSTVTALHRERAEQDSMFAEKLRDVRREVEEREAKIAESEVILDEMSGQVNDLRSQLSVMKRDALRYQRECEMYRQQVLLLTDQQQQLHQLQIDNQEREKLIAAQEQCMKELEIRCESASNAAREYEQRFLRLQHNHQVEADGASQRESQWRELLSTIAGALLLLTREVEDSCVRLVSVAGAGEDGATPIGSSPGRRSLSMSSDGSDGWTSEMAEKNLERTMELMEHAMGSGADETTLEFRKAKDQFGDTIQRQIRRFNRAISSVLAHADDVRSRSAKAHSEVSKRDELIGRAEALAAAANRDNVQLRREKQELIAQMERMKQSESELKAKIVELINEAEKREESNAQHSESLKQLIEGADLDLHRQRMRTNELEALNTRILAQKALADEEVRSTIQQLRQSVALKDAQVARLRSDIENLQMRFRNAQVQDVDLRFAAEDVADGGSVAAMRSISVQDQSTAGGSVVGSSFLRQQNQQLAAHIEALQRRLDRMKEEKESALQAVEKQRQVIRQHEDVLEVVSTQRRT